jgi:heptosyltransferase-2
MNINKILAVRNDRFGEFLLNIPAFRALKEAYPQARLDLVVSSPVKELAECIDFVDQIRVWENKKHNIFQILSLAKTIKQGRFDLCVIFNPSKELNLVSYLARIPRRVGYARKWGFLLTQKIPDNKHLGNKHEIDSNLELAYLAGASSENSHLSITINEDWVKDLLNRFNIIEDSRLVVIHPWTSDEVKQWPLDNFYNLAKRLTDELKLKILIVGGKEEINISNDFSRGLNNSVINLTGQTTLKELGALLKKCRLLISNDSGPVHLAASVGTPLIALFRNDIPAKGYLRWGPCHKDAIVIAKDKLSEISVEEVFNKAKSLL